jgi:hypothetical protein
VDGVFPWLLYPLPQVEFIVHETDSSTRTSCKAEEHKQGDEEEIDECECGRELLYLDEEGCAG